jgi:hypothetical protein
MMLMMDYGPCWEGMVRSVKWLFVGFDRRLNMGASFIGISKRHRLLFFHLSCRPCSAIMQTE